MKFLAITAILCLILAGASFAGEVTMTEVLTGGNLTLTMPGNFGLITTHLGGDPSFDENGSGVYYVEDSRGTGAGWNLGVQISQFQTGGTPNRTIATNKFGMTLASGNLSCTYGQAIDATNGPNSLIISKTTVLSTEVEVIHALAGYGMGKYRAQINHTITVDADVYAGSYTATLTATLNNVP